jgi:uncharacterized protein
MVHFYVRYSRATMKILRGIALLVIIIFLVLVILLYIFQTRLIFYPGKLAPNFKYKLTSSDEEVFLTTKDGEKINGLYYEGSRPEVILYFHGNAGDLSGWQFVAEDFTAFGFSLLIIDYRGYGKSSGSISENGFYQDAKAAYDFLRTEKKFSAQQILVYGRSIGSGVAVHLAAHNNCRGLILESPHSSLGKLANEKLPFFFPSLYMKYTFNNMEKINRVKSPVVFIHGVKDEIIPASHTERLFKKFEGKKKMILVPGGSHNDLNAFSEHRLLLSEIIPTFFD